MEKDKLVTRDCLRRAIHLHFNIRMFQYLSSFFYTPAPANDEWVLVEGAKPKEAPVTTNVVKAANSPRKPPTAPRISELDQALGKSLL